jgi:hypothetical protein
MAIGKSEPELFLDTGEFGITETRIDCAYER